MLSRVQPSHALRSQLLAASGFRHAFFTRNGGASIAPFDSLNFATHLGESPTHVAENFAIAAEDLGVKPEHILCVRQVHGTCSHVVTSNMVQDDAHKLDGDAVIAHESNVACGVRVADCAPILIADRQQGRVAAVHAGWRGTEQNIVGNVVRVLQAMGCNKRDLIAAVGPHIEVCCFETGPDVAARLSRMGPANCVVSVASNHLDMNLHADSNANLHVSLRSILNAQLIDAGIVQEQIDHIGGCTMCDAARFFSYRRDGQRSGRLLAAIVPRSTRA